MNAIAAIKMAKAKANADQPQEASRVVACNAFETSLPDMEIGTPTVLDLVDIQREIDHMNGSPDRGHLGMSVIGDDDERKLWLDFRWSLPRDKPARILRIFDLGHMLEKMVIDMLRRVTNNAARLLGLPYTPSAKLDAPAFQVFDRDPQTGKQFRMFDFGGHFAGSMDGAIQGIPESKKWHVFDVKSCKDELFKKFKKDGMKATEPKYYGQAICYMAKTGMERAIYFFYNKDTSELHFERVKFDAIEWHTLKDRAERILRSPAPMQTNKSKTDYKLRMNSDRWQRIYWAEELPERAHCRNCVHSAPLLEGEQADWFCNRHTAKIGSFDAQWKGCKFHSFIPEMVPIRFVQSHGPDVREYALSDNSTIFNVPDDEAFRDARTFTSAEMIALSRSNFNPAVVHDPNLIQIRELGGRIHETANQQ